MSAHLSITKSVVTEDSTGRKWGRLHIALIPDVTAQGSLAFASWDYELDSEADFQRAQTRAIENARSVILNFTARIIDAPISA